MRWVYFPFLASLVVVVVVFFFFGVKNLSGFLKYQVVCYFCRIPLFLQLSFQASL